MTAERQRLRAIPISGLSPDSLGNYLASLGLLRLLVRKWPSVRMAWHDDVLHVLGGPPALSDLLDELVLVATTRGWTAYERGWAAAQKKSTKAKSGQALALWQASAEEAELEMLASHAVAASRVSFNPLLGSGGNAGKRAFSDGWKEAVTALAPPAPKKPGKNETDAKKAAREDADKKNADDEARRKRVELEGLLLGTPTAWLLEKLNAASWFSEANKLYNSGQGPYREGSLSPWSMALACEGLTFLAGGASRRLGARARAVGAFPFVTRGAAPEAAGEAGRNLGEVWAPVWERPMTVPEVRALFARGRAELRGRGVLTPSAFATAIMRRGVDAGISEFRRFTLGRTTSPNTFEPRFEGRFGMQSSGAIRSPDYANAIARLHDLVAKVRRVAESTRKPLPPKSWVPTYVGPLEATLVKAIAAQTCESHLALLDAVVTVLDRVDRNRSFREARVSWEPLPIEWLPALFADEQPETEARLALALVSGFPSSRPLTMYRFGVEWSYDRFEHAERAPARWVWGPGDLPRVLSVVLARRTLDWESTRKEQRRDEDPVRVVVPATCLHISRWLDGAVDERLLAKWISRLALFNWRTVQHEVRALARPSPDRSGADGTLCLFGLFQPLFDRHPLLMRGVSSRRDLLDPKSGARTPAAARTLVGLLRAGHIDAAVRLASSRFAMAGTVLARTSSPWSVSEPERLLASILFPIPDCERAALNERWLRPRRRQGDQAHV